MSKRKFKLSNKVKTILVIAFIIIYLLITYISLRGQYLEYAELGKQYVDVFYTNIQYKYSIMGISFVLLFILIFLTNLGIKKGLKPFFEQEKKEMPKLPNKSLALIIAATPEEKTTRSLAINWGVLPVKCKYMQTRATMMDYAEILAKENGVQSGELILVTGGKPGISGDTSYLELIRVK